MRALKDDSDTEPRRSGANLSGLLAYRKLVDNDKVYGIMVGTERRTLLGQAAGVLLRPEIRHARQRSRPLPARRHGAAAFFF